MTTTNAVMGLMALALVAGCKHKKQEGSSTAATAAASGSAQASAPSPPVPCPDAAALEKTLRTLRKLPAGGTVDVHCTAGRFGEPGWHIQARVESDGKIEEHVGILAAATGASREIVPFVTDEIPWGAADTMHVGHEAHDLDGDGIDELVAWFSSDKGGYMIESFAVLRVKGDQLVHVQGQPISYDSSAAGDDEETSCDGERKMVAAGPAKHIVVHVKAVTGTPAESDCLAKGTHTFALQGDKLVAVK